MPVSSASDSNSTFASRASNYFQLLAMHNETSSRPATPADHGRRPPGYGVLADGYFNAFFREEKKLGMGANGSVFLCQHVLDGNALGHFAVKKIAVGESHDYLLKTLKEIRLLETLRHPNIISYHHSWLETCRFSSFGPPVPTLFVLMQYAEAGSLDDYILIRQGGHPVAGQSSETSQQEFRSRSDRIRAFRERRDRAVDEARQRGDRSYQSRNLKAIHLLSAEEIRDLFADIVSGLGFLHGHSILHLDLKPGNVLLTFDDDRLIPRAMLSDFGASQDMLSTTRNRSGITGTLEYSAPEALLKDSTGRYNQLDSKADMWALGVLLHKLLFFRTPYIAIDDLPTLEQEILAYRGFMVTPEMLASCARRGLPEVAPLLVQRLLNLQPSLRPSCERVQAIITSGQFNPRTTAETETSLIPRIPRPNISPWHRSEPSDDGTVTGHEDTHRMDIAISTEDNSPERGSSLDPDEGPSSPGPSTRLLPSPVKTPRLILDVNPPPSPVPVLSQNTLIHGFKSALLVGKIVTLAGTRTTPWVSFLTVGVGACLAACDLWSSSLPLSLGLGIAHVGILAILMSLQPRV
jgi:serine/threonine protein kinase